MASAKHLQQAQRHLPTTAPPWIPIGRFRWADSGGKREPSGNDKGDKSWLAGFRRLIKLPELITVLLDHQSRRGRMGSPSVVVIGSSRRRVVPASVGLSRMSRPPSASAR